MVELMLLAISNETGRFMNKSSIFILFLLSIYQLFLVIDRWIAFIKHHIHFGANSGTSISLGTDTFIFGFLSLVLVIVFSVWQYKSKTNGYNNFYKILILITIYFALVASISLLILVLLPSTRFR